MTLQTHDSSFHHNYQNSGSVFIQGTGYRVTGTTRYRVYQGIARYIVLQGTGYIWVSQGTEYSKVQGTVRRIHTSTAEYMWQGTGYRVQVTAGYRVLHGAGYCRAQSTARYKVLLGTGYC